jgi:uroporphyrinogen-III synthase
MSRSSDQQGTRPSFQGGTVALFEAREAEHLARLVAHYDGAPWRAPAVCEVPVESPALSAALETLIAGHFDMAVLLTGVGLRGLLRHARERNTHERVLDALGRIPVICRGPKPVYVLRQHGLRATHLVPSPHTTAHLLAALAALRGHALPNRRVLVVSAGEAVDEPRAFLRAAGADVTEIETYRWALTGEAASRLAETIRAILDGTVNAVLFTSQIQVRHLFAVAASIGLTASLANALRERVLVGAVGPTSAAAVQAAGVEPHVVASPPAMGHLVKAMAHAWPSHRAHAPTESITS